MIVIDVLIDVTDGPLMELLYVDHLNLCGESLQFMEKYERV